MTESIEKKLEYYLDSIAFWIEDNGWDGWDPYDIYNNRIGLHSAKREDFSQKIVHSLLSYANDFFPNSLRKIFRVKPSINAKAMGLFATAFLQIESIGKGKRTISGEAGYEPCFRWLDENKVEYFGGCGWGYPFDWRSRILIPKDTPTVVNSAIIGDAYWHKYKYHNDLNSLTQCKEICRFIISGLNRNAYKNDGSFCFSYTPIDNFQVHNANLFGAEFLIRIGKELNIDEWIETGLSAANFSLSEIRNDGTLNYWSKEQSVGLQQDTYHSGFEIRALNSIACLTGYAKYNKAAERYFHTWIRDFVSRDGEPIFHGSRKRTIEVHSCAEALLCATKMFDAGHFSRNRLLEHVHGVMSAVSKLWVIKTPLIGYFALKNSNILGFNFKTDIPYIRWGQAWMFNALSTLQNAI